MQPPFLDLTNFSTGLYGLQVLQSRSSCRLDVAHDHTVLTGVLVVQRHLDDRASRTVHLMRLVAVLLVGEGLVTNRFDSDAITAGHLERGVHFLGFGVLDVDRDSAHAHCVVGGGIEVVVEGADLLDRGFVEFGTLGQGQVDTFVLQLGAAILVDGQLFRDLLGHFQHHLGDGLEFFGSGSLFGHDVSFVWLGMIHLEVDS